MKKMLVYSIDEFRLGNNLQITFEGGTDIIIT